MRPSPAGRRPSLRLAHITDTHVSTLHGDPGQAVELATRYGDRTDCLAGLGRVLASAASRGAALAVITGDLTDHGTREEFQRVLGALRDAPLPVEIVPGNHDHYGHRHEPRRGDSPLGDGFLGSATITRYEQALGPRWWSADIGGVHFLGLDWFSAWCGIDRAEQQRFAAADLATRARGLPVIVLSHDQPDEETLALIQEHAGPGGLLAVLSGPLARQRAAHSRRMPFPEHGSGQPRWPGLVSPAVPDAHHRRRRPHRQQPGTRPGARPGHVPAAA
jgi:3',5'-cyclic AMP phosphodiesterase CpdA